MKLVVNMNQELSRWLVRIFSLLPPLFWRNNRMRTRKLATHFLSLPFVPQTIHITKLNCASAISFSDSYFFRSGLIVFFILAKRDVKKIEVTLTISIIEVALV